jgi:hypothetical protein
MQIKPTRISKINVDPKKMNAHGNENVLDWIISHGKQPFI